MESKLGWSKMKGIRTYFKNPKVAVWIGVFAISFAAIFVKITHAPSLITAFYRLFFSLPFFIFYVLLKKREEIFKISIKDFGICFIGGTLLAFHFVTWFTSLSYTSVASSLVLVTSHPLLIISLTIFMHKEYVSKKEIIGVLIAFLGCIVISGGDYRFLGKALYGDFLAFLGAAFMAFYILIGRKMRSRISAAVYIFLVYLSCWIVLAICVIITNTPLYPYTFTDYLSFLGLAWICHIFGHGVFNWALAYVSPVYVSTAIIAEVVGSILLAIILFGEMPTLWQMLGGIITISGIFYYSRNNLNKEN